MAKFIYFMEGESRRKGEYTNCLQCKVKFIRRISKSNGPKLYCSNHCSQVSRSTKTICKCATCNKDILVSQKRLKASKSGLYFCNSACMIKAQCLENGIKAIHPPHYGQGHTAYKRVALRNKKHECEDCGLNFKPFLVVHHKDGDRTNNVKENLELLCLNHHAMRHMKILISGEWIFDSKSLTPREMLGELKLMIESDFYPVGVLDQQ